VENAGKRGQDFLIATLNAAERPSLSFRGVFRFIRSRSILMGEIMFRTRVSVAAAAMLSAMIVTASAQSPMSAPGASAPKESSKKLTKQKLSEMRAKWKANKPKLKACRTDARKKGLDGDDRWFFIEECMNKS
jgi:hypothetical protein